MLDTRAAARCTSQMTALQRLRGRAALSVSGQSGRPAVRDLYQSGSAKIMLPRVHDPVPQAVFLNTGGGLTGGDRMELGVTVTDGATLTATTQTAERAYASAGGAAQVSVDLAVGAGSRLNWLPQETILFDRARLQRRLMVTLGGDAEVLIAEMLVLGREAMGETVSDLDLSDWRDVRRDGRPVLLDPLRLTGASLASTAPAVLNGARALALVALVAPGAPDRIGPVRAALAEAPESVAAAASGWDGKLIVRAHATEPAALRRLLCRLLPACGLGVLPRVWQN